jgi:hypothetical protein
VRVLWGKENASGGRCFVFIPVAGVVGTCGGGIKKSFCRLASPVIGFFIFCCCEDRIKNF